MNYVQSGDTTLILPFIILIVVAIGVMVFLTIKGKKKDKNVSTKQNNHISGLEQSDSFFEEIEDLDDREE